MALEGITRHKVKSSNLDWIAYDKEEKMLYIQFKSGGLYVYYNVPEKIVDDLLNAGSKGRYHAVKIKYNYEYKKLN